MLNMVGLMAGLIQFGVILALAIYIIHRFIMYKWYLP